jgi:hypothetical protein
VTPVIFVATLVGLVMLLGWSGRRDGALPIFVVMYGVAVLIAAFFGPAFEIRTTSAILWITVFVALPSRSSLPAR